MKYNIPVQQHKDGYLYIEFPKKLMKKMGWETGDTIDWQDNKDGSWSLLKIAKPSKKRKCG